MRLAQRLLLGSFAVVSLLVVSVVAVVDRSLRTQIVEESTAQLGREARLVALEWRAGAEADALADAAGEATRHRVTFVDTRGRVVGDSEFDDADLAALDNHATRPEIVTARTTGTGSARRRSSSAGDEELYVAVRTPLGFARVSLPTRTLEEIFDRARRDIYGAGLLALVVSMTAAFLFSRAVSRPIIELRDIAGDMAGGDLSRRPVRSAPGEVGDLARALHLMAEQLDARLTAHEEEESLLTELFDSLNEGAVAVDARGQVVRLNEVGRRLLSIRDRPPFAMAQLPPEPLLREAVERALAGHPTEAVETIVGERTLTLTARPLTGGGAVLAVYDLTPIRRLEAVRRDFVANVSHELKTPLTIVNGFAETLLDEDLPAAQRAHFASTIVNHARRMQRIVDDLLDLSRIESGGWRPNPMHVDVEGAARDAILSARPAADAKGVTLALDVDPAARTVWADPTAVRQILGNLVDNAARHTAAGTVTVFTRVGGEGCVWLGVRDTGIGIPPEHLSRIFERFYRVDAGRSRDEGGTGLGLAIVRHLTEAHGGRVEAESTVGRGTTIRACFVAPPDTVA